MSTHAATPVSREIVLMVAARIGCDPRTARKLLEHGVDGIRNVVHQERARAVLAELGIGKPEPTL